jgi:hypothetical protein
MSVRSQLKRHHDARLTGATALDFDKLWEFFGKLEDKAGGLGDEALRDMQLKLIDVVEGRITVSQFADYVQRLFGVRNVDAIARKLELWLKQLRVGCRYHG